MSITIKKRNLAQKLFQIDDNQLLDEITFAVEQTIAKYKGTIVQEKEETELEKLHRRAKEPTPYHIPLEQVAKEQGYSTKKFLEAMDNIDHSLFEDETLEEMLNALSK